MKLDINKFLFFVSYTLILISYTFKQVLFLNDTFFNVIYYIPIILLIILFLYQNFYIKKPINKKSLIILTILFILGVISSITINNTIFLRTFLFICTFRNIKFDDFIKYDAIVRIVFVITLFVLYCFDLTEVVEIYRAGGVLRYAFGFWHPNKFGLYLMLISIDLVYLFYKSPTTKKRIILSVLIALFAFIVYFYSKSRASFCIILCCLILLLFNQKYIFKLIQIKPINFLAKNSVLILTIITFLLIGLYRQNNIIAEKIDSISSERLYWASTYLENYDLNLFGNEIQTFSSVEVIDGQKYFSLDNSFVHFTLYYGVIIMSVIVLMFRAIFKTLYGKKKYIHIICLVLIIIYSFMESILFKFYYNPFLLLFNYVLFNEDEWF
ncbi:MAG: hypothetical protein IJY25_04435 [Bacilli bacterium]|nr:hypothetical protein [Bacilli bacterium]